MPRRWEPGDVTDCTEDDGGSDRADPPDVTQPGPRSSNRTADSLLGGSHLSVEPGDVINQFGGDHYSLASHLISHHHAREE